MNSIQLIGRLTKDPEIRYTQTQKAVCEFNLAVNRIGQEQADFITCVVWEKQAENLNKYQDKGSLIAVSGALRVDKYQTQEGENRYKTYVLANNIEYLESKSNNKEEQKPANNQQNETDPFTTFGQENGTGITEDDLPF